MNVEFRVVSEKLQQRYGVSGAEVEAMISREVIRFGEARVQSFVPLLVERAARQEIIRRSGPPGPTRRG